MDNTNKNSTIDLEKNYIHASTVASMLQQAFKPGDDENEGRTQRFNWQQPTN